MKKKLIEKIKRSAIKGRLGDFTCNFIAVVLACTVERAFGGAKYVYRGIKREDGNSQSGVRLSCGIDYTRFRPYGYGWELRRLAG